MKKIILLNMFWLCCAMGLFAQLKVGSDGNVGIKLPNTSDIPISPFSVGNVGDSTSFTFLGYNTYGYTNTLQVIFPGVGMGVTRGIYAKGYSGAGTGIGVQGECVGGETPYMPGRAIGVLGLAGGYTSGKNYGVMGVLTTSVGAGIVGTINNQDIAISGQYAGYFDGNVKVTGTINGVTISSSDSRFKKNIAGLEERKSLNNVLLLKPVQYNLEQQYVDYEENGKAQKYPVYNEKSQLFQKKHYGLIAQELKELYPDLVYEDDNGFLGVNYTGLIPVLVQSIQELNQKIERLESPANVTAANRPDAVRAAALFQNTPNPFSQSTQIKYYLPETTGTASLCIYDMQGKQLKQYPLTQRGEGSQPISGSELSPGIYLYALIADGTEIDVKRMILTE
jgi:hypothetical protein